MVKSNAGRRPRTQSYRTHRYAPRLLPESPEFRENYIRARDLPRLIALWPSEIDDLSCAGRELILRRLRGALRAERNRGRAGHWSYDLNRHLGLARAYRAELARLESLNDRQPPTGLPRPSGAA